MNQYTAQCLASNRYSKILIKRRKKKKEGRKEEGGGMREEERERGRPCPQGKTGLYLCNSIEEGAPNLA